MIDLLCMFEFVWLVELVVWCVLFGVVVLLLCCLQVVWYLFAAFKICFPEDEQEGLDLCVGCYVLQIWITFHCMSK